MQETQETQARSLGQEDPLESETATYSSILAWEIPWTEEPVRLQSRGCKESDTTMLLSMHEHACINSLDPKKQGSLTSRI